MKKLAFFSHGAHTLSVPKPILYPCPGVSSSDGYPPSLPGVSVGGRRKSVCFSEVTPQRMVNASVRTRMERSQREASARAWPSFFLPPSPLSTHPRGSLTSRRSFLTGVVVQRPCSKLFALHLACTAFPKNHVLIMSVTKVTFVYFESRRCKFCDRIIQLKPWIGGHSAMYCQGRKTRQSSSVILRRSHPILSQASPLHFALHQQDQVSTLPNLEAFSSPPSHAPPSF